MKIKWYSLVLILLLNGCNPSIDNSNSIKENSSLSLSSNSSISSDNSVINSSSSSQSSINSSDSSIIKENGLLNIYSLNDLHGAIDTLAAISGYIKTDKDNNIKIATGDMFQGTAISNLSKGRIIVDILNEMKLDAFVIGNHEFDWGLDVIAQYKDGNLENGEANFPFLGANIYDKTTNKVADFLEEYQIVEFNNLKVGIIGVIGSGLENSINATRVKNYQFKNPVPIVASLSEKLRVEENVDIVVVANHNGGQTAQGCAENLQMVALQNNQRIDAIINGHSHQNYFNLLSSGDRAIPVIQAGANGDALGNLNLIYNFNNQSITATGNNISASSLSTYNDAVVSQIIENEIAITGPIFKREIGVLGERTTRAMLASWECNVIRKAIDVDFAMINENSIRSYYYYANTTITIENIINMMPFDNIIKTVDLTGSQVMNICNFYNGLSTSANLVCSQGLVNNQPINYQTIYSVAAIDYIFDKTYLDFLKGQNIYVTNYYAQDLMIMDIEAWTNSGSNWFPSNNNVKINKLPK